jgi:hypothetical protein
MYHNSMTTIDLWFYTVLPPPPPFSYVVTCDVKTDKPLSEYTGTEAAVC